LFGAAGGTFIDVGANIGLSSIPIAQNAQVLCHCFEPEPANFSYLATNVKENCHSGNVLLHNLALFDHPSELEFELSSNNMGDHRVRISSTTGAYSENARRTIRVTAVRLDDVFRGHALRLPLAVKIDTQGSEPQVVAGGRSVLGQASLVHLEFWPYGMERTGGNVNELLDFFASTFDQGTMAHGDSSAGPTWMPARRLAEQLADARKSAVSRHTEFWNIAFRR
jgi:FkbM family methyltransferase